MKTHASRQIMELGRYNVLPVVPMVIIFGIYEKPVQRAFQKCILLPHSDL